MNRDATPRVNARALAVLGALCACFVLVYARAAGFGYVWDDVATIQENAAFDGPLLDGIRVTQHGHIDPSLTGLPGQRPAHESYRPLLFLTFATEVRLFGRSPMAMHVTNVILGVLAIVLAFDVARRLLGSVRAGLFVAALFALHPLQVESVCYVSARADVLSGLLALASLALALRGLGPLAALAFLASLFTKEATVGLPLVLLGGAWWLRRRELLRPSAWLLGALPLYAGLRSVLVAAGPSSLTGSRPIVNALLELPGFFLHYASLFAVPRGLSTVRPLAHWTLAGWLLVGVLSAVIALALRRGTLRADLAVAAFGLLLSGVTLAPASVVALMMGVAADRYAYLPVFGFSLGTAALALHVLRGRPEIATRPLVMGLAVVTPLTLAGVSAGQVSTWASPGTLYANAVDAEPTSAMAHYGLGLVRANEGRWAEALPELQRAVELDPNHSRARNNLAVACLHLGMLDLAESTLRGTLEREGQTNFRAWYNLSELHRMRGQTAESCDALRHAVAVNPGYARAVADLRACAEGTTP